MSVATRFTEADLRIMGALDAPRTTRELADVLRQELREAWAEDQGLEIAWDTDSEPLPARLLAWGWAKDKDTPMLMPWEVYPRLRKLERAGLVERVQIEGQRPMLWRRTRTLEGRFQ